MRRFIQLAHEIARRDRCPASRPVSECLATVDSDEGRQRVADYLTTRPFPHYEPAPGRTGLLVRIAADGTRTIGRFVNRQFQASD